MNLILLVVTRDSQRHPTNSVRVDVEVGLVVSVSHYDIPDVEFTVPELLNHLLAVVLGPDEKSPLCLIEDYVLASVGNPVEQELATHNTGWVSSEFSDWFCVPRRYGCGNVPSTSAADDERSALLLPDNKRTRPHLAAERWPHIRRWWQPLSNNSTEYLPEASSSYLDLGLSSVPVDGSKPLVAEIILGKSLRDVPIRGISVATGLGREPVASRLVLMSIGSVIVPAQIRSMLLRSVDAGILSRTGACIPVDIPLSGLDVIYRSRRRSSSDEFRVFLRAQCDFGWIEEIVRDVSLSYESSPTQDTGPSFQFVPSGHTI
ncbi:hypothetical protein DFS33DRAFT_1378033 [Desarmillaria ectypa]|nr:hypothetical protein DFS33DRAFT_1378033 [Desarmillaria ectypa]